MIAYKNQEQPNDGDISTPEGMRAAQSWLQGLIDRLKDMGMWLIPRSRTVYQFDKKSKVIIRMVGPGDSATETVAKTMGWAVVETSPEDGD